ncbi:MAG: hypothetical protein ACI965_000829 [Paraglaciecola sp.]|jgi:uncharacterized protein YeaC (DUF1315 family)
MNIEALLQNMRPEIYDKLRVAVETGKWLDGSLLTEQQRDTSMQAVMLYQAKILKSEQHMTVGENGQIVQKSRQQYKSELSPEISEHQTIARFKQDDI